MSRFPARSIAPAFGLRLQSRFRASRPLSGALGPPKQATLRNWKPGDRVRLRYSSGPRKVKEVLERCGLPEPAAALWPVLELDGRIVWMQGVELEPEPGIGNR